jgi:hypothetical protein
MVTISILVIGRTMTIRKYDNKEQLVLIIQLNSYLFTRKFNNPETNYKVSMSTKNETTKHKENTKQYTSRSSSSSSNNNNNNLQQVNSTKAYVNIITSKRTNKTNTYTQRKN